MGDEGAGGSARRPSTTKRQVRWLEMCLLLVWCSGWSTFVPASGDGGCAAASKSPSLENAPFRLWCGCGLDVGGALRHRAAALHMPLKTNVWMLPFLGRLLCTILSPTIQGWKLVPNPDAKAKPEYITFPEFAVRACWQPSLLLSPSVLLCLCARPK
jgi:hypothetical protein